MRLTKTLFCIFTIVCYIFSSPLVLKAQRVIERGDRLYVVEEPNDKTNSESQLEKEDHFDITVFDSTLKPKTSKRNKSSYRVKNIVVISPSIRILNIPNRVEIFYGGVVIEYYFTNWVSGYYSIYFGTGSNGLNYAHITLGMLAMAALSEDVGNLSEEDNNSNDDTDDSWVLLLALLIVPEGINFHYRPVKWFDISPFIGFGADISLSEKPKDHQLDLLIGIETGLKINVLYRRSGLYLIGGPFLNYYHDLASGSKTARDGYVYGLNLGIAF